MPPPSRRNPAALANDPPLPALRQGPLPARVANLRFGTASWTDKTLIESGSFYPPGVVSAEDRLRYYVRHFPVVEVDSSFYALPSARNAALWVERTPEDFAFGVKAFAALTQHPLVLARLPPELRTLRSPGAPSGPRVYPRDLAPEALDEIWRLFREALAPLHAAGILGYVLFQFPPWFPCNRTNLAYLEACAARLPDYPVAVEFREPSWLSDRRAAQTFDFLRRRHLIYVAVDAPQGTRASVPPLVENTSDALAVVRFHGRNAAAWVRPGVGVSEKFRYLYREEELREWHPRLARLAARQPRGARPHEQLLPPLRRAEREGSRDRAGEHPHSVNVKSAVTVPSAGTTTVRSCVPRRSCHAAST